MVRDTSKLAYHSLDKTTQSDKIYRYLLKKQVATRREIAMALGLDVSAVAGRVNEMLGDTLEELERRPCPITGILAHPVRLKPKQMELLCGKTE